MGQGVFPRRCTWGPAGRRRRADTEGQEERFAERKGMVFTNTLGYVRDIFKDLIYSFNREGEQQAPRRARADMECDSRVLGSPRERKAAA